MKDLTEYSSEMISNLFTAILIDLDEIADLNQNIIFSLANSEYFLKSLLDIQVKIKYLYENIAEKTDYSVN